MDQRLHTLKFYRRLTFLIKYILISINNWHSYRIINIGFRKDLFIHIRLRASDIFGITYIKAWCFRIICDISSWHYKHTKTNINNNVQMQISSNLNPSTKMCVNTSIKNNCGSWSYRPLNIINLSAEAPLGFIASNECFDFKVVLKHAKGVWAKKVNQQKKRIFPRYLKQVMSQTSCVITFPYV